MPVEDFTGAVFADAERWLSQIIALTAVQRWAANKGVRGLTRARVRYYLHNLDGLQQEISDINADLEQYRAMVSDSFYVCQDADPIPDHPDPDGSKHSKHRNHSNVEQLAVSRADFITRLEQELFDKKTILAAINCVLYYLNGYDRQVDKQIIQLRYREHLPWGVICRKMGDYNRDSLLHKDQKIMDEIISNYNVRIK
ncbi:MAG: hypothetical protein WC365_07820 [Candidatus Babeliales bacterium]